MRKTIFYATTNAGKFEEVKRYIEEHEPTIEIKQFEKDIPEVQSTNQKEIAIDKANKAWDTVQKPVLVDDSGIFYDHYNNFPGTMSKFVFYGIGFEGLLKLAQNHNKATRKILMIYKEAPETHQIFEGICKGEIVEPESFESHPRLPYDAIFKPLGATQTMARLRGTAEEKKYSYRIQALKKFLTWFKENSQK